jgi:glycosyltransferase involved in cell wall biosynthesis
MDNPTYNGKIICKCRRESTSRRFADVAYREITLRKAFHDWMADEPNPSKRISRSKRERSDAMRVMFDSQIFCHQRFGGIARYITSMTAEMAKLQGVTPLIVAPFHFNEYLERLPQRLVYGRRVRWLEGATPFAFAASAIPSRFVEKSFRPDIVHNTFYFPAHSVKGARRIFTVYDMIQEKYPLNTLGNPLIVRWKATCVRRADHVICISENTRRDVLDIYGISADRVSVTHLGYDNLGSLLSSESAAQFKIRVLRADAPFILFVGSRKGYKNFDALLRAYSESNWLRENFFLLCFGGGNFEAAERAAISRAGVADRVKYGGGSDADLANCYRHASVFVYPSLYEGFGIPPLEAMSLDCPVACSGNSSLPEVVGDAAETFEPTDADSIRAALESVLGSRTSHDALVERGRVRRQLFSWKSCAERTVDVYRTVLGHR